ncbi:MAG: hypothetical protein ACREVY_11230 [Gammaproteobacteria bacterium]
MANPWQTVKDHLGALSVNWASYTALGSFSLYALGYLSLRFHLTALGIGTDLAVLDERYLFTGARFFVYLVSTVPTVILLLIILAAIGYLPYRILLPRSVRTRIASAAAERWARLACAESRARWLACLGIVLSVLLIQLVMRQCFFLGNLLVAERLSGPLWLQSLILDKTGTLRALYFAGLVGGVAITGALLWGARVAQSDPSRGSHFLGILAFLFCVQVLFLPVNYGVLIVDKTLPKVRDLGGEALQPGQEVWLAWEGEQGFTYFVRDPLARGGQRSLVTLLRKDIARIEIIGYDPILREVFLTSVRKPGAG